MFIRMKRIKGQTYFYLVQSYREGDKVKQRVIKYLGINRPAVMEDRWFDFSTGKTITRRILDIPDMLIEVKEDGKLIEVKE